MSDFLKFIAKNSKQESVAAAAPQHDGKRKLEWVRIRDVRRRYQVKEEGEGDEGSGDDAFSLRYPKTDALVCFDDAHATLVKFRWPTLSPHMAYYAELYLNAQQSRAQGSSGDRFYNVNRDNGIGLRYKPLPLTLPRLEAMMNDCRVTQSKVQRFIKLCKERVIASDNGNLSAELVLEWSRSAADGNLRNVIEHEMLNNHPDARRYFLHTLLLRLRKVYGFEKIEALVHHCTPATLRFVDDMLRESPIVMCFAALRNSAIQDLDIDERNAATVRALPELTAEELQNALKVYDNRGSVSETQLLALDLYRDVLRVDFFGRPFFTDERPCYSYWPATDGNLYTSTAMGSAFQELLMQSVLSDERRATLIAPALQWLKDSGVVVQREDRLYLKFVDDALCRVVGNLERVVERHVRALDNAPQDNETFLEFAQYAALADSRSGMPYARLADEQRLALSRIHLNPIVVCSGRGGTGKTSIIEKLTQLYGQRNGVVCLTAFVGKCISNLKRRTDANAQTIHKHLHEYEEWKKSGSDPKAKPLYAYRVLIIDETSLVDLLLFDRLLSMLLECARLQKVVFVGDVNQLPSIGAGALLEDMCDFLGAERVCYLTENHRNASSTIFDNATRIAANDPNLTWDNETFIHYDPERRDHDLERILDDLVHEHNVTRDATQCIGYRNKDEVEPMNRAWRARMYDFHTRGETRFQPNVFRNEFIYYKRNNYDWELFNGEKLTVKEFFDTENEVNMENIPNWYQNDARRIPGSSSITNSNEGLYGRGRRVYRHVALLKDGGELIHVSLDAKPLNLRNMSYAYCMSIHKFQGCEEETIIYYVRSDSRHANWRHVYTAITRSKRRIIVVARKSDLEAMIRRQAPRRASDLAERLWASPIIRAFMEQRYQHDYALTHSGERVPMHEYAPFREASELEDAADLAIFNVMEQEKKRKAPDVSEFHREKRVKVEEEEEEEATLNIVPRKRKAKNTGY